MFLKLLARTALVTSLTYRIAVTGLLIIQVVKHARKK